MALVWLCVLMVSSMRMVCAVLVIPTVLRAQSPVTTVSRVLPVSLCWWVRDADRSVRVEPLLVMVCAVLAIPTVRNARVHPSSVPRVRVTSLCSEDLSVWNRACETSILMAMYAALARRTV